MSYFQGFLVPVPVPLANKAAYLDSARETAAIFVEYGAIRVVETWGVDLKPGKTTDFQRSVKATADETVVFSWTEWPDRETCDAAAARMESDPRWEAMSEMPFDGKRLVWGGFEQIFDTDD